MHPTEQATLQCVFCSKRRSLVPKSYHCTPKCFTDAWQHHRTLHERAAAENNANEDDDLGRNNSAGSGALAGSLSGSMSNLNIANNGPAPFYPSNITQKNGGETLVEVGACKTYTPIADDIGHVLKFECVVANAETKQIMGHPSTILTSRVIPAPSPSPRKLVPVNGADVMAHLDQDGRIQSAGSFTVLSYNILSDTSASSDLYSYCPPWALSWPYRRQNLLREIVGYRADVVCLQEVCYSYGLGKDLSILILKNLLLMCSSFVIWQVQSDHFHEIFAPELEKHGYQALYKRKTNEVGSLIPHTPSFSDLCFEIS